MNIEIEIRSTTLELELTVREDNGNYVGYGIISLEALAEAMLKTDAFKKVLEKDDK